MCLIELQHLFESIFWPIQNPFYCYSPPQCQNIQVRPVIIRRVYPSRYIANTIDQSIKGDRVKAFAEGLRATLIPLIDIQAVTLAIGKQLASWSLIYLGPFTNPCTGNTRYVVSTPGWASPSLVDSIFSEMEPVYCSRMEVEMTRSPTFHHETPSPTWVMTPYILAQGTTDSSLVDGTMMGVLAHGHWESVSC